jgi:hypothetical protein
MRKIRWIDLALLPFGLCVLFLLLLGKLFGLTYKQISVVFNLWLQGAVLLLSGLAPATAAFYRLAEDRSWQWLVAAIPTLMYGVAYIYGFAKMLAHYHLPFDDAFDVCVEDLQVLAIRWKTTYQIVNLVIFVLFFLILIGLNVLITHFIIHF